MREKDRGGEGEGMEWKKGRERARERMRERMGYREGTG